MEKIPDASGARRRSRDGRIYSSARESVLRTVENAQHAVDTAQLVAATGLHENTVRGHLDQLLADGYLQRRKKASSGRGRPSWVWTLAAAPDAAATYANLAAALASALVNGGSSPHDAAYQAGLEWGTRMAHEQPADSDDAAHSEQGAHSEQRAHSDNGDSAVASGVAFRDLMNMMRAQGFAPECVHDAAAENAKPVGDESDVEEILLRRCPLLPAVRGNEQVACAVHAGMIEGFLRERSPRSGSTRLVPFVAAGTCAVRIGAAS
ncbi:hypothetical protein [Microbacterium sp. YY-01]|uniref:hypothetical protein n=1 Tax=Microbacterium sp. YY-01 TaxID=3421634 RepID=UPI003D163D9D